MFDETTIRTLVHSFYATVREDALLGPIFNQAIGDHWDAHLARLCDFWSSILLRTQRYDGRPMRPHLQLPIGKDHFERWLALFRDAARATFPADAAAFVIARAETIASSFQMGIAVARGERTF